MFDKATEQRPLYLPRLRSVTLDGFGIYQKVGGRVHLDISKSVFCLAGANGLGKSTLLTTIIYGLCGYIRRRGTLRLAPKKRRAESESYSEEYFLGRLKSENIQNASVEISFEIGKYTYILKRKIYRADGLESLLIKETSSNSIIYNNDGASGRKISDDYESHIANHSNLGEFDRLIFIIQYVLSFDEDHHLLFWDSEALEDAVFTCIGLSSSLSVEAEDNRYRANQIGSQIRNLQFAKKQTRDVLRAALGLSNSLNVFDKELAEELYAAIEKKEDEISTLEINIESEKSVIAQNSHKKIKYENDYRDIFDVIASGCSHIPIINSLQSSLDKQECSACGDKSAEALALIKKKIEEKKCPVCDSQINEKEKKFSDDVASNLREKDTQISQVTELIKISEKKITSYEEVIRSKNEEINNIKKEIKSKFPDGLQFSESSSIANKINEINQQLSAIDDKKKQLEEKRKDFEKKYTDCYKKLEEKYVSIESHFVPIFRDLAEQFLGIPININLNKIRGMNARKPMLSIEINGTVRNSNHQLSESQRFFIDIALKMSLIRFCTGNEQNVTMLLDTPEGSLNNCA